MEFSVTAVSLALTVLMVLLLIFLVLYQYKSCKNCPYRRHQGEVIMSGNKKASEVMDKISTAYSHLMYESEDLPTHEPVRIKLHKSKSSQQKFKKK